jgi:hypothetical protein
MNLLAKRTPTVVKMQAQESVPVASLSAPPGYVSRKRGTVTAKWIASTAPMSATAVSSPLLFRWFSCVSSLSVPPPTLTQPSSTHKNATHRCQEVHDGGVHLPQSPRRVHSAVLDVRRQPRLHRRLRRKGLQ